MLDAIRKAALGMSKLRKKKEEEVAKPKDEKLQIELDEEKVKKFKFGKRK